MQPSAQSQAVSAFRYLDEGDVCAAAGPQERDWTPVLLSDLLQRTQSVALSIALSTMLELPFQVVVILEDPADPLLTAGCKFAGLARCAHKVALRRIECKAIWKAVPPVMSQCWQRT